MAFKMGNTTAETENTSIDAFMTEKKDHHEFVKVFLLFDADSLLIHLMRSRLLHRGMPSLNKN
jgi:hypothetical protein